MQAIAKNCDEESKNLLRGYGDALKGRSDVSVACAHPVVKRNTGCAQANVSDTHKLCRGIATVGFCGQTVLLVKGMGPGNPPKKVKYCFNS